MLSSTVVVSCCKDVLPSIGNTAAVSRLLLDSLGILWMLGFSVSLARTTMDTSTIITLISIVREESLALVLMQPGYWVMETCYFLTLVLTVCNLLSISCSQSSVGAGCLKKIGNQFCTLPLKSLTFQQSVI
jgi:hypothetical protein